MEIRGIDKLLSHCGSCSGARPNHVHVSMPQIIVESPKRPTSKNVGGTAFFVAKDYALKMASSDDNQKASYDRKIRTTIIAGVSALITTQFVSWILGYFK